MFAPPAGSPDQVAQGFELARGIAVGIVEQAPVQRDVSGRIQGEFMLRIRRGDLTVDAALAAVEDAVWRSIAAGLGMRYDQSR